MSLPRFLFAVLLAILPASLSGLSAYAQVTPVECAKIRELNSNTNERLFFQADAGFDPVVASKKQFFRLIKTNPARIRVIYLVQFVGDEGPTLINTMVRFLITDAKFLQKSSQYSKVYTYNNLKKHPLWTPYDEYQKYHRNEKPNSNLKEWFHIGPGFGWTASLVDTKAWEEPRRFFSVSGDRSEGEGVYSFLTALTGVSKSGSCTDLSFVLPPSINKVSFAIRNLQPQNGMFLNPHDISVEMSQ